MADETPSDFDPQFFGLIASLHQAAMMEMGKLMNPATGKAERHLEGAQRTIDLIAMLQTKTEGNLTKAEKEYVDHVLYELRMNYLDESDSPASSTESSEGDTPTAKDEPGAKATPEGDTPTAKDEPDATVTTEAETEPKADTTDANG